MKFVLRRARQIVPAALFRSCRDTLPDALQGAIHAPIMALIIAICALVFVQTTSAQENKHFQIAAASSLRQVWPELMQLYAPDNTPPVTFGSSGNLMRQLQQGAPFAVFLSASLELVSKLEQTEIHQGPTRVFAEGKLAWVAPVNSPLSDWLAQIDEVEFPRDRINRLAIANPQFAPYGHAAKQVLESHGLSIPKNNTIDRDSDLQFALGENATQALQFALSGATDGGIVPMSLLNPDTVRALPEHVVKAIDSTHHDPVIHVAMLSKHATPIAQSLIDFLLSAPAQKLLQQYGFDSASEPKP